LSIPHTVKRIEDVAFYNNYLEGVSFFSGLEEIGSQAFGQNNLT